MVSGKMRIDAPQDCYDMEDLCFSKTDIEQKPSHQYQESLSVDEYTIKEIYINTKLLTLYMLQV